MSSNKIAVYFDMDGVLFDWVAQYNARSDMPLEQFSAMPRNEREVLKRDLFDYSFFAEMQPIERGFSLLHQFMRNPNVDVRILSATGRVNKDEVIRGKLKSIEEHIGEDIEVLFVDKVEDKYQQMKEGYDVSILIDDRESAMLSWSNHGGIGVLFK